MCDWLYELKAILKQITIHIIDTNATIILVHFITPIIKHRIWLLWLELKLRVIDTSV